MFNGLQFALNFNNFEIVDIKGHQLPVDEEDFVLNNNIFTFSKVSPNKVLSGYSKPLMTFLLKPSTGTPNFEGLNSHFV
ncbi:MAG: hypothetical protein IPF52_06000 [Saprospiraceae bacterium]|nr:hypothetical protein [Saprospiraceae bacterium]